MQWSLRKPHQTQRLVCKQTLKQGLIKLLTGHLRRAGDESTSDHPAAWLSGIHMCVCYLTAGISKEYRLKGVSALSAHYIDCALIPFTQHLNSLSITHGRCSRNCAASPTLNSDYQPQVYYRSQACYSGRRVSERVRKEVERLYRSGFDWMNWKQGPGKYWLVLWS